MSTQTIDFKVQTIKTLSNGSTMLLTFHTAEQKKQWVKSEARRRMAIEQAELDSPDEGTLAYLRKAKEEAALLKEGIFQWAVTEEEEFQKLLKGARQRMLAAGVIVGNDTDNGSDSRVHGVICKQAITNSRWWQEGVSLWNPEAELEVQLNKAESFLFHMDSQPNSIKAEIGFPTSGRADKQTYAGAKEAFKGKISQLLDAAVGQTYTKGQVIAKGLGVTIAQRRMNQPLTLVSYKLEDAPFAAGAVQANLKFEMKIDSPWKKIRGYGLKATLAPWDIFNLCIEEAHEPFVVLHSMSGLKGKPLDIVAFCHAVGGAEVNVREGVVVPTSGAYAGKAFSIAQKNSIVDQWRNKKAQRTLIHFDYSRSEWEFILACDKAEGVWGTPDYDVVAVNDVDDNTVRISAWIEMLVGEMPLNVEVSLPEESSGRTQITPEMLAVLTLQNRIMGEEMNKLGAGKRNSLTKLLKMFNGSVPKDAARCCIQEEDFLKSIQGLVKDGMNDQQVIQAYEKQYPSGAVFSSKGQGEHKLYFDFGAIQGIATYVGGSGEGVSHSIAEFLRQLPLNLGMVGKDSQIHANFALLCSAVKAWFKVQLESKNLKKKLVSTVKGTAVGSKIRTLALPELTHQGVAPNCLPKVGVNPNDDILQELARDPWTGKIAARFIDPLTGKFNPWLMQGEFVTVFRTPMPMQGACELVITEKVGVGHLALLMHIWAFFNEGDSDGDGVSIIAAFHYLDKAGINDPEERRRIMLDMNTHPMGMAGYVLAYGKDVLSWPCAEFCSHKDAWSKKKLIVEPGSEAEKVQVKKGILPYARNKAVGEWIDTVGQVSNHYLNAVSTSYNIAVVAVNDALDIQYQIWNIEASGQTSEALNEELLLLGKKLLLSLRTCAISWRLLYEGLGLAGYSEGASRWFKLFTLASSSTGYVEGPFGPKLPGKNTKKEETQSISTALAEGAGFSHRKDAVLIANELRRISVTLADARTIEHPDRNPKRFEEVFTNPQRYNTAIVRRAQRLCSQGDDVVLKEILGADNSDWGGFEEEGAANQSCLQLFINTKGWEKLACPWQAANLKRAAVFTVEAMKVTAPEQDSFSDF